MYLWPALRWEQGFQPSFPIIRMSQVPPAISPTLPTNHRTISRYISNQAPTSVTIDPADASYDTTLIKDTHLEDSNIVNNTTQTYSVVKGPFKALNNDSTRSRNFNREHSSETDPLLPRNEREGHYRRPLDTCPTWWVELRTIVSYALPVLGYVNDTKREKSVC